MKKLIVLTAITLTIVGCGKRNTGGDAIEFTVREELSARPTEYARDVLEVTSILRDAVQRGYLYEYHNTKWVTHRGQYLCTSTVIDDLTFKIVR